MSAAAKHTVLAAASLLILGALAIVVPAGGASSDRDRQAPTKPLNLRVTSATSSVVSVAWDPATDDVEVEGYYVFDGKDLDDRDFDAKDGATVEEPRYDLTGLRCGESTLLTVIAFDSSKNRSEKASLTVAAPACRDTQPPTVPAEFTQLATTRDAVVLGWQPSVDDTGVVEYAIYRELQRVTATSEPRVTLSALSCDTTYVYRVDAADAAGNRSLRASVYVRSAPCTSPGDTPPPQPAPTGWTVCATEGQVCSVDTPSEVRYGANGVYTEPRFFSESVPCTNATFGDPARGLTKRCERRNVPAPPPPTGWTVCATEGQVCSVDTPSEVRYGANGVYTEPRFFSESVPCTNATFGDPARGLTKRCERRNASTPPPPPPSPTGWTVCATEGQVCSVDTRSDVRYGVNGVYAEPRTFSAPVPCTNAVFGDPARGLTKRCERRNASTTPPPGDTTAPSTPTGLAASNITQTGLYLSWNASTDNVGIVGYDVYRSGVRTASPTGTGADQSGLTCGTSSTFGVAARDAAGNVSQRAPLSVSTSACSSTTPPAGDTTSPSTPTGLAVSGATGTSVSLSWNASTDNVGVAGYRIYLNGGYSAAAAQLSATVPGLTCGSAYTFEVEATDGASNRSGRASVTGSTTPCPDTDAPSAPLNVAASSRTMTSIALSWSASSDDLGVVGYGLYRAGVQVGTSNSTIGIFSGLACGTNHTLAVDAFDAAGNRSPKSTVMVATTACADTQAPSAPTSLAATNVAQIGLTLTWTASSDNVGVTGYDVLRNGTQVGTVPGTSLVQAGLKCGTGYTFAVVARDAAGNSSSPAQLSAATAQCSPTGTAFYVDPAGSDAGDGSATRPWRTLAKACASVPSNAGATIVMRAGTYVESATCNLPPKTNLQGAGGRNGATTIRGSADPLVSLVNASASGNVQTVSAIRLDGQNRTAGTLGMRVQNVRGLTISDMLSEGFRGTAAGGALDLNQVWNCEVKNSTFRNGAGIFSNFASGTLGIRNATDCVVHDIIAYDDKALAIKGGWVNDTLTNVEFYNVHATTGSPVIVTPTVSWPAISFEMNEMDVTNVTIRNSYFNATLSLTNQQLGVVLPSGQWHYKIYNNFFDIAPSAQTGGNLQYALELDQHSSEVHHNYFRGGVGPISNFETDAKRGNSIHHNVFDNQENWAGIMRFRGGLFDTEFYKNTFVARTNSFSAIFSLNEMVQNSNPRINGNIFMSTQPLGDVFGSSLSSAAIDQNVFYQLPPKGTNARTVNPQLPLSGGFPAAYVPVSGSPAAAYGAFADGLWSGVGPS